jgi:hypothetical protein
VNAISKDYLTKHEKTLGWTPLPGRVLVQGIGKDAPAESVKKGRLTFQCYDGGPSFESTFTVMELRNFDVGLIIARPTTMELGVSIVEEPATDTTLLKWGLGGCDHRIRETAEGKIELDVMIKEPEMVDSTLQRRLGPPSNLILEEPIEDATTQANLMASVKVAAQIDKYANTLKDLAAPTVYPSLEECRAKVGHLPMADQDGAANLLFEYRDIFHIAGSIGKLVDVPQFDTSYNGPPFAHKPIPLKPRELELAHAMQDKQIEAGMAKELPWEQARHLQTVSRVFFKHERTKLRLCTDYTTLNKGVGKSALTLPLMETIRHQAAGFDFYIQMDGTAAYNQMEVTEQAGLSMAIILPPRRPGLQPRIIIPLRLHFGHEAAPGVFQHAAQQIFKGIEDT